MAIRKRNYLELEGFVTGDNNLLSIAFDKTDRTAIMRVINTPLPPKPLGNKKLKNIILYSETPQEIAEYFTLESWKSHETEIRDILAKAWGRVREDALRNAMLVKACIEARTDFSERVFQELHNIIDGVCQGKHEYPNQ